MSSTEQLSDRKTDKELSKKKNTNEADVNGVQTEDTNAQKLSNRRLRARELELPDNSTWGKIAKVQSERERIERAQRIGLSESATWGEIFHYMNEVERQNVAVELGLAPTASWRRITTQILALPGTASEREILVKIRQQTRIKQQSR